MILFNQLFCQTKIFFFKRIFDNFWKCDESLGLEVDLESPKSLLQFKTFMNRDFSIVVLINGLWHDDVILKAVCMYLIVFLSTATANVAVKALGIKETNLSMCKALQNDIATSKFPSWCENQTVPQKNKWLYFTDILWTLSLPSNLPRPYHCCFFFCF